ncbi:MAG: hypothetical protein P8103_02305 [Candidatus Thiodiazotropha sp.]
MQPKRPLDRTQPSRLQHRLSGIANAVFRSLLIFWLLLSIPSALTAATPSTIMSQAMLTMMDAMGDLAHRFKGSGNWSLGSGYTPYSSLSGLSGYPRYLNSLPGGGLPGGGWPYGMPLQSPVPGLGGFPSQGGFPLNTIPYQSAPSVSPVDGIWVGRGGEIVLVMYGHFRIYATAEIYRDGRFEIVGDRLIMYDPESDRRMVFEYYLEDGQMLLRNEAGTTLLFKQLPIPIPPYSLFANPGSTFP